MNRPHESVRGVSISCRSTCSPLEANTSASHSAARASASVVAGLGPMTSASSFTYADSPLMSPPASGKTPPVGRTRRRPAFTVV